MSFLAPFYLFLAAGVAVPLVLHLLRRRIGMRVDFPAARYLARAEREHSRTLKIRNLLLMFLRILTLLAVALAAARPVARWAGAGHAPTAIALVVDNSLSSAAVGNGRPLLDQFKAMARDVLARSAASDRVWLVTADGRVRGGTASLLRDEIARLEPLAGAGDPARALTRAASIVRAAGLDARQLALLTDGQRTTWKDVTSLGDAQVIVWVPPSAAPANRAVTLAEARPTRWTPRGLVAARFQSRDSTTYRITLGGRTFARGTAAPGEEVTVHAAPPERGWLDGSIEIEPDELSGDNARHFAVWLGPPPGVSVSPGVGPFAQSAVDVLRSANQVAAGQDIPVVNADEASALPAFMVAPQDPVKLGAANRALERIGVPWRFGTRRSSASESAVHGSGVEGAGVTDRYDLVPQPGAVAETLAVVGGGREPWIVAGPRYVLVASPLVADATSFPIRAGFVPWLAATLTERLVGEPGGVIAATPGGVVPRPRWAEAIEVDGARVPFGDVLTAPPRAGTFFFMRGDRRVGALVVNPEPEESVLDRYTADELAQRIRGDRVLAAADGKAWTSMAFRTAARRSLVHPALLVALVLVLIEAVVTGTRAQRLT